MEGFMYFEEHGDHQLFYQRDLWVAKFSSII